MLPHRSYTRGTRVTSTAFAVLATEQLRGSAAQHAHLLAVCKNYTCCCYCCSRCCCCCSLQVRDISTNEAWQDAMHLSVPVLAVLDEQGSEVRSTQNLYLMGLCFGQRMSQCAFDVASLSPCHIQVESWQAAGMLSCIELRAELFQYYSCCCMV
jgi:hypothetical protein